MVRLCMVRIVLAVQKKQFHSQHPPLPTGLGLITTLLIGAAQTLFANPGVHGGEHRMCQVSQNQVPSLIVLYLFP